MKRRRERHRSKIRTLCIESQLTKSDLINQNLAKLKQALENGIIVCIDCSYEALMSDKECGKFAQQLCRAYGANKQASTCVSLQLVNFNSYGRLAKVLRQKCDGFDNYIIKRHPESPSQMFAGQKRIVYLSPDASSVLKSLSTDDCYVIGGLVDEHLAKVGLTCRSLYFVSSTTWKIDGEK